MRTLKIPPPHAVLIILIIAAILLLSCSQVDFDNYSDSNDSQRTSESPSLRRFNVSMNTAQTFLDVLEKDKPDTSKREISKILPVAQYGDTLLYVVNFKDDKGWLIVSGDKRTESILAQAEKGVFDFHTDNPGIATWLDQLAEQIYALKHNEKAASDTLSENYIFWNRMEEYARHISGSNTQKSKSLQRTMPVEGNGYWDYIASKPKSFPL
ncbi:MAG: hypothetical protein BGN96_08080 [Bacteroidales bacterium 45-6]|nr:MAG: hypothetical protein BGN96_08080 [Bacteroidales bacterium 45-6]